VRSVVLTGSGPAFCAGADLKSRGDAVAPGSNQTNPFVEILRLMWDGPKPVIAAVNGHAFGGGIGLVAAADIQLQRGPPGPDPRDDLGGGAPQARCAQDDAPLSHR
jgi:enoyl-CoA hydratase/carnithine racemase